MKKLLLISLLVLVSTAGAYVTYRYYFPEVYYFECIGNTAVITKDTNTNKTTDRHTIYDDREEVILRDHGVLLGKSIDPWLLDDCHTGDIYVQCGKRQFGMSFNLITSSATRDLVSADQTNPAIETRYYYTSKRCERRRLALD